MILPDMASYSKWCHLLSSTITPKISYFQIVPFEKMVNNLNVQYLFTLKAIGGGGQGSFLHMNLRWKLQSQGCQCFLRNEDISPCKKNIAIWLCVPPYFPIVKFHENWPLKSVIWSYKIKTIGLGGIKLHKKVKSN